MNNHNAHATIGLLSSEIETVESDIARIDENIKKLTALRGQKNLILNSLTNNRQRIVDVLTPVADGLARAKALAYETRPAETPVHNRPATGDSTPRVSRDVVS